MALQNSRVVNCGLSFPTALASFVATPYHMHYTTVHFLKGTLYARESLPFAHTYISVWNVLSPSQFLLFNIYFFFLQISTSEYSPLWNLAWSPFYRVKRLLLSVSTAAYFSVFHPPTYPSGILLYILFCSWHFHLVNCRVTSQFFLLASGWEEFYFHIIRSSHTGWHIVCATFYSRHIKIFLEPTWAIVFSESMAIKFPFFCLWILPSVQ